MQEFQQLSTSGLLGYGFPEASLAAGMAREPDMIGVDGGSTDPGPYYLGSGKCVNSRMSMKRDLRLKVAGSSLEQHRRKHVVTLGRLSTVILAALAFALAASPSSEAETMRLGHIMSANHHVNLAAQKFAEEVKKRTNGAVEIQIFPSGQLGQEKEMFESIRLGSLELGYIAGNAIEAFEPSEGLFSLPYFFKSYEHAFAVQDGPVGKEIAQRVLTKTGVRYLAYGHIGFRNTLTRARPIRGLADFAGLKIRVPPSPSFVNAFKLLGANPTPIPGGEMYTALQTGVVDGVEGAPDILDDFKMFEVAKNYTLTHHIYTDIPLVIAEPVWKAMAPERRKAFEEAARVAELFERDIARQSEARVLDKLRAQGVVLIDVDTAPMRERMQPYYEEFSKRVGGPKLIDQAISAAK